MFKSNTFFYNIVINVYLFTTKSQLFNILPVYFVIRLERHMMLLLRLIYRQIPLYY